MSWLTDCNATGKRMEHIDGSRGRVLSVDGEMAEIEWEDDGSTSLQHEDDLFFIEDNDA